jgi:hypothetical protein
MRAVAASNAVPVSACVDHVIWLLVNAVFMKADVGLVRVFP